MKPSQVWTRSFDCSSETDTVRFGHALADVLRPGDIVGLIGELGTGKTFLVRAVAERLGVDPNFVSSPTFVLMHEYAGRLPIFHLDVYRLTSAEAFAALGVDELFAEDADGICLIEWADRFRERLPADCLWVKLHAAGATARRMDVSTAHPRLGEALMNLPFAS